MATIERYETKSGDTLWQVRYRTPDNRSTRKRGFTTKRDAERFATKVEVAKMTGDYVAPSLGRTTIGELGPAWLERQRGHVKLSGLRAYESLWRVNIESRWGAARIADIRHSAVQAWVAELAARRSPSTVIAAYSILGRILDDAVKDRLLVSNPVRGVKLPKRPPRRNVYLTADQLERLADESGRYPLAGVAARRRRAALG